MKRIILDTNFLMIPGQFKVDIFGEIKRVMNERYSLYVFQSSIDELLKLAKTAKKDTGAAKIALKLIKQQNLKTLQNSGYTDKVILENVTDEDIVCTQDKPLRQLLKRKFPKIRLIVLRAEKHLTLI